MIKKIGENFIQELLKIEKFGELEKELMEIYPDGFELSWLDKRIVKRMKELAEKYDSIQKPVQVRKNK